MNSIARLLVVLAVSSVSVVANAQEYVYWTSKGDKKIQRNNVVGSPTQDIITGGLETPSGIDIHNGIGKVYWTDAGTKTISRSDLDGSKVEVLRSESSELGAIAVAENVGKIYWIDVGSGLILRANLDGTQAEKVAGTTGEISSIAVDEGNGKLYWTDVGDKAVRRSNLDGSDVEDIVATGLETPSGVAVHSSYGKVYFTDEGQNAVMRADLNGKNLEAVVKESGAIRAIVIDEIADRIYWIGAEGSELRRAYCDGQGVETVVGGLAESADLALIPEVSLSVETPGAVPSESAVGFQVSQPYPNPARVVARFVVTSDRDAHVDVTIVDVLGRVVASVYSGHLQRGEQRDFVWNTAMHPNGVYFVSTTNNESVETRMVTVRR